MKNLSAKEQENLLIMISQFFDRVENETRNIVFAGYASKDVSFIVGTLSRSFASEKVWIKQRLFEFNAGDTL